MKLASKIFQPACAVIGIVAVCMALCSFSNNEPPASQEPDYLELLRNSGPYTADDSHCSIKLIQDSARAKEIRDYFQLDTLYSADDDTWTKTLAIAKFVASNIPHDNQKEWPEHVNAIGLWEYTKNVAPAFNCRLHSLFSFELFLAAGIDAKFITCMPQDDNDNDCHVVNEVWLPELGKWAMIDTDMGGHYITDKDGTPLSLAEMREHYISGDDMILWAEFKNKAGKEDWYYSYMSKNTYWFSCWGELSYYQEDRNRNDVVRDHYYNLIPQGFQRTKKRNGSIDITDADSFWAPLQK